MDFLRRELTVPVWLVLVCNVTQWIIWGLAGAGIAWMFMHAPQS
jgi:hypothetical protein